MFQLSLVEQIDLSLAGVSAAYEGHVRAAARLSRQWWYYRLFTLAASAATLVLAGVALQRDGAFVLAATVAATVSLAAVALYVSLDPAGRVQAHRASAARLAVVCEGYRGLLAEIHDHALDLPATRDRRNALVRDTAMVLEQTAPDDHYTYEIARVALAEPPKPAPAQASTPAA